MFGEEREHRDHLRCPWPPGLPLVLSVIWAKMQFKLQWQCGAPALGFGASLLPLGLAPGAQNYIDVPYFLSCKLQKHKTFLRRQ